MSTNRSKDRSSLCSFPFADGRHCRTLECGGLAAAFEAKAPAIHARKEAHRNNSPCSLCSGLRALCGKSFSSLTSACWRSRRQGYRLSPFRQLCVRLRSQLRPRTPLSAVARCSGGSSDPPARWPRAPCVIPRAAIADSDLVGRGLLFAVASQTLHLAQHEYINPYGTNSWRETVRHNFDLSADPPSSTQEPAPPPTPAAASDESPASE